VPFVACVTMLLITLLDDNEARPPSIVAYLRKRNNVVLSNCYSSANVIEPRVPHTCNNTEVVLYIEKSRGNNKEDAQEL
jgi:hypothetical protein